MKKRVVGIALLVVAAAALAQDRRKIDVWATNDQIAVSEPMYESTAAEAAILWEALEGFSFPGNGIVFKNPQAPFACMTVANGRMVRCNKQGHIPGRYDYSVNLVQSGRPLPTLDPTIINR